MTIVGGGISLVPLPYAVRGSRIPTATGIILLSALWCVYSCEALLFASRRCNRATYQSCANAVLGGFGGLMVQVTVVLNSFGISVSMLDVYADVAPSFIRCSRTWCLIGAGTVLTPIVMLVRRIEWLAPLSLLAVAFVFAFIGFVVVRAAIGPLFTPVTTPPSFDDVLETTSVVMLAFVCQFNLLPVYASLAPLAERRPAVMTRVVGVACGTAALLYATIGVLGYLTFGEAGTSGDALEDYSHSASGLVFCDVMALGQLLTLPLLSLEGVHNVAELLAQLSARFTRPSITAGDTTVQLLSRQASSATTHAPGAPRALVLFTGLLWCVSATTVAILVKDTSKVQALVGASCAAPLMLVFPVAMAARASVDRGHAIVHYLALLLGVTITLLCTYSSIRAFVG